MKFTKILASLMVSLVLLSGCAQDKKAIITVNGEPITKSQYDEVYKKATNNPQYKQLGDQTKDPNSYVALMTKDRVIQELIVKKILDQEVKKRGIVVTEKDIQAKKDEIIDKIGSKEKFDELMKQNNISERQLKEDLTNEVEVNKLVEATANTKVSDKEVKDFYQKNKPNFNYPERVRASHILIEANPENLKKQIVDADKSGKLSATEINAKVKTEMDKKMALAKEIRAKAAKDPKQFAALAKQYSQDKGSAQRGGDLGMFPRNAMVKPFSDAAFKLKPGVVSEVVVSEFGNHIIIVTDRAKAGIAPFDEVKSEIRSYLEQKKKIEALQKLFDGLKSSAKVVYNDPAYDPQNIQKMIREKAQAQTQQTQMMTPSNAAPQTPAQ